MEEKDLKEFKKEYASLVKKYNFPPFEEFNQEFSIERIADLHTELLVKEIRKFVIDKVYNYMHFVENLLNPTNVSMFVFSVVKTFTKEDKAQLSRVYEAFARIQVKVVGIDLEFNEENEARFILETYEIWKQSKKIIFDLLKKVDEMWDVKAEKSTKGYFG